VVQGHPINTGTYRIYPLPVIDNWSVLLYREVKMPEPGSAHDDGLTKDYTGAFPNQRQAPRQDKQTPGLLTRVVDPDPDSMTFVDPDPHWESGSRGKKMNKNKFIFICSFLNLGKNLSKVLLWIRIRIWIQ
jgi:hypothetical protein